MFQVPLYDTRLSHNETTAFITPVKLKSQNSIQSKYYYTTGMTNTGSSPARSRMTSPTLRFPSQGEILTQVKSQQTSPSLNHRFTPRTVRDTRLESCRCKRRKHGPRMKRTHSTPNLYSWINKTAEDSCMSEIDLSTPQQANQGVTNAMNVNQKLKTIVMSDCRDKCSSKLDRSTRIKNIKQGNKMFQSFSIQTITSSEAETFV